MSTALRPSRNKSRSPRNSISSSKRRALHARSDSDTNELAGKQALSAEEQDDVYGQSPFPRLPSHVLSPKGDLSIFEDQTATAATNATVKPSTKRHPVSKLPRSSSPKAKLKAKSTESANASRRGRLPPAVENEQPIPHRPRKRPAAKPGESSRKLGRANSRVRSMVSAIESASVEGESLPPTPKARSLKSPKLAGRPNTGASISTLPPVIPNIEGLSTSPSELSPVAPSFPAQDATISERGHTSTAREESGVEDDLRRPPPIASAFRPWDQSSLEQRPRSASTPTAPTDAFLLALVADGTLQYPRLERRSITSLRTDTSSVRGAFPQPLTLRRKRARSHISRAESAADQSDAYELSDMDDETMSSPISDNRPVTPPRIIEPDAGHWTPGRWTAELEDTVAPLDRHPLRAQHSYYRERDRERANSCDSRPTSRSSMQSTSSAGGFYRFLNDSRTAWAKNYYCNEGALRQVTPPHVTSMAILRTPSKPRQRAYSADASAPASASASGPTQTPESDAYAKSIYIPRARPFAHRPRYDQASLGPASSEEALAPSSYRTLSTSVDQSYYENVEVVRDDHLSDHRPSDPPLTAVTPEPDVYRPTPRLRPDAHLSPDRGVSTRYSLLQAPSLDGTSWHSAVNLQVGLAILGVVFPFGMLGIIPFLLAHRRGDH